MSQNTFPFGQPAVAIPQQNTPQTQTPAMAAPPAGGDMASLLAGMNITPDQLAKIAYLMQTGQLTLPPPPPPTLPVATPPAPPPAQAPSAPATDPRLNRQALSQDIEMDKEEGEVEEGEVDDAPEPESRDFLRTPPKGPRKRSRSPLPRFPNAQDSRRTSQQQQAQPSTRPANGVPQPFALSSSNAIQTNGDASKARRAARNAAAKEIVLKLHGNGYSFDDVAKAISNRKVLRRVYNQLGLPAASPKPAAAAIAPTAAARSAVSEPQRKVSQPKKAAPTKPAAVDRSAYLAKLQAAKNKKAEPAATSASPVDKPNVSASAVSKPAPTASVAALAEKVASKNDLIRQRMAALAAERAAKEEAKRKAAEAIGNGEIVVISSDEPQRDGAHDSSRPGLGDGLARAGIRAAESAASQQAPSPSQNTAQGSFSQLSTLPQQSVPQQTASPTLNRGFGLPGLFTTSSPLSPASFQQQQTAAFAPPPRPAVQSRPQSASAINGSTAQKRPYGQVNDDAQDRVVIVDSDEDDSEDDMDIDDDDEPGNSTLLPGGQPAPGLLKDFPPKPTLSKLATSLPGTPGTPGTPSQAQLKMDQEIAEMKRKIAEAESRKRRKTGSTGHAQQVMTPSVETATAEKLPSTLTPSADSGKLSLKEQREQLEQRLRDLQSQGIGTGFMSSPAPVTAAPVKAKSADALTAAPQVPVETSSLGQVSAAEGGLDRVEGEDDDIEDDYEPEMHLASADATGQTGTASATALHDPHDLTPPADRATDPDVSLGQVGSIDQLAHEKIQPTSIEPNDDEIDDDDLDDIYADSAESSTNNELPKTLPPTTTTESDDEQDETDDAMDTSGDPTDSEQDEDDAEEEYEPELHNATLQAVQERQTTSSELNHGADLQMRMEAEQSSSDSSDDDGLSSASSPPAGDATVDQASEQVEQTNQSTAESAAGTIADILAPELQPVVEEPVVPRAELMPRTTTFKPYESPLVRFKDFRYHPEFANTIPGGHRSLTYSNSIDSGKVLCPFEAAGQECKVSQCTHQHFKDMSLSDNDLLRLIGADRTPARTPEENQRWKNGLTAVVQKLRETNVGKDVDRIASRIAEYRREFLGDPTQTILFK